MKSLNYPRKFVLISFVFVLPLGLLLALLFTEIQEQINFTRKELIGTEYLRSLQRLSRSVLLYQIQNQRFNLTNQRSPSVLQTKADITHQLRQLEQIDQQFGETLNTHGQVAAIQKNWNLLQSRSQLSNFNVRDNASKTLVNQLKDLRFQVGDQSNLILDPDLDTYYLMDTVLLKLPEIQDTLVQIQLLSQQSLLTQTFTPVERSHLLMLTGAIDRSNSELTRKLNIAFQNNQTKTVKPQLSGILNQLSIKLTALVDQLNQLTNPAKPAQSTAYFRQAEAGFKNSAVLWEKSVDQLDYLLQRRINRFQQRRLGILTFVLFILAIATYLFIGFYHGMMEVVSALSSAAQRMLKGDLQTVRLDSQDELADVVRSFNSVADALREAEAKYRGIFENAVEGIFQTTPDGHYLTANPMLATIYGYDNSEELIANMQDIRTQLYVDPANRDQFIQVMQEQGSIQNFEAQVYRKDGSIIWIAESARAIGDKTGNVIRYEGTVMDITQRKQAESEIEQLTQQLKSENLRMSAELAVTRQLQQMLLPSELELDAIAGLEIAGFMEPAAEVGGDYYDVLQQQGKVNISIGDVTGHGLESGVVMLMAQTAVRTLLATGETNPKKFLGVLNEIIYENTRRMRSPKNMSLALLEYESGVLRLTGQHEELILIRKDGTIEAIDTLNLGFPLGLESDISSFVSETQLQLQSGDVAVLYTDGITEAMNEQNQQYGLERLYRVLQQNYQRSAHDISQAIIANLMAYIGQQKIYDDITVLILKQR